MQFKILAGLFLLGQFTLTFAGSPQNDQFNWASIAKSAKSSNSPIIVLYSADNCSYCERLKDEVLNPLFPPDKDSYSTSIKEVNIEQGGKMTDFDGDTIRSRLFKNRYDVFSTPTLLILDFKGVPLAPPIVGYSSKESYTETLNAALSKAGDSNNRYLLTQIQGYGSVDKHR
jgi:thioredoxin-related protein